ncbi:MAG TPA: hypothetical protein VGT78_06390 [Rhizomicrobium sp.]|nr:hypothetical protein [Rhizomicrobium sp.]
MKLAIAAGAAVFAFLFGVSSSAGAPLQTVASLPAAIPTDAVTASPHWFDAVVGQKLVAVDGSAILVSPTDGGLSLEITTPGSDARNLSLSFMSDALGSISEGGANVVGVFRQTATGIEAQYADGHSEIFAVNSSGGLSMTRKDAAAKSYCMSWYPEGHSFGEADRKAALAAYANRLGLATAVKSAPALCSESSPAEAVAHAKPHHARMTASAAQTLPQTILVRTSAVHLIDAAPSAPLPAAPPPVTPPAARPMQQLASVAASPPPPAKSSSQDHGASACLSVDSDGANWGFRNGCSYSVQVAYCLMNGGDKSTACGIGSAAQDIPANGFVSVLSNSEIVTADQEFRWIGCTGGSKEVAAHLDRTDPPAGRCVALRG